jgi:hypothetical protein
LRIDSADDFDSQLQNWLCEAYLAAITSWRATGGCSTIKTRMDTDSNALKIICAHPTFKT